MEAARLGIQDFQMHGFSGAAAILGRGPPAPALGIGLPFAPSCEPWAAAAAALGGGPPLVPPLSTLSHALPGFLSNPQVGNRKKKIEFSNHKFDLIFFPGGLCELFQR